jgi:hypothetical protein
MALDWIAVNATIVAALITAANLGARVTGSGFVMYTLASAIWIATGVMNDFEPLSVVVMHGVLVFINLFGVWRWLGRERRYEDSREHAQKRSRWARVPTLFSAGSMLGSSVAGRGKDSLGTVVDAMFNSDEKSIAYVVISEGGIAGAGETLRAVPPEHLKFEDESIVCDLSESDWHALPPIENDHWPTKAPPPVKDG